MRSRFLEHYSNDIKSRAKRYRRGPALHASGDVLESIFYPDEEETRALWSNALFVFDASALLKVFQFSPEIRNRFFEIAGRLHDRFWLPNQAAEEYHNGLKVGGVATGGGGA